jgi:hypothetical protein
MATVKVVSLGNRSCSRSPGHLETDRRSPVTERLIGKQESRHAQVEAFLADKIEHMEPYFAEDKGVENEAAIALRSAWS